MNLVCYPDRLLFRAGDYPDKSFSMTDEELVEAAGKDPVPIDLGHPSAPSPLDGKLGHVGSRRVVFDEQGQAVLRGDVYLPEWMGETLPKDQSCLSCTWRRTDKKLRSISLVTEPRVRDAVLMAYAEFASRHDTYEGQGALQAIHDHASRNGARCSATNTEMHSGHEVSAIQKIHDTAVEHGASCSRVRTAEGGMDLMPRFGRETGAGIDTRKEKKMGFAEKLANFFHQEGVPLPDDTAGGKEIPPAPTPDAKVAVLEAQLAAQAQALASLQEAKTRTEAVAFADQMIAIEHRAMPFERGIIIEQYQAMAKLGGEVTFTAGGQQKTGSVLEAWKLSYTSRPKLVAFNDLPAGSETVADVIYARPTTPVEGEDRPLDMTTDEGKAERQRLLSFSDYGRAALNNGKAV